MTLLSCLVLVFLLGAAVGSGLNVAIGRIPYEKSLLWPSSHCGSCFQPVHWYDNIPLVSYWVLRGRCRSCGASFSIRYFLIELFTALAFLGLFYLEIIANVVPRVAYLDSWEVRNELHFGMVPMKAWLFWVGHALLLSFLIVTTFTDLDHMEIPLSVTITGMLVGLVLSMCFPWPWPNSGVDLLQGRNVRPLNVVPAMGWQPWPFWKPSQLPSWMQPGSWQLGLATGLAGVLAGIVILRAVRFLFGLGRGIEGLGLGDADLMMMAGAFVGWQVIVIAFFVSVFPALLLGIGRLIFSRDQQLPFGPSLALGVLLTLLGWRYLPQELALVFFDRQMLIILGVAGAVFLLLASLFLRVISVKRGPVTTPGDDIPGSPPKEQP